MQAKHIIGWVVAISGLLVGCSRVSPTHNVRSSNATLAPTAATTTNAAVANDLAINTTTPNDTSGSTRPTNYASPATTPVRQAVHTTVQHTADAIRTTSPLVHPQTRPLLQLGSQGSQVQQLQILLTKAGYLPLQYVTRGTPATGNSKSKDTGSTAAGGTGTWSWRYQDNPPGLIKLWNPQQFTLLTKSAVMTFEQVHQLAVDGVAGPDVMAALQQDIAQHKISPYGFSFVEVSLHQPQRLQLWHNGKIVVSTLVNGGIPQSPTVLGTYPIYLQYKSQTMSGTDISGYHYRDTGVPYVSYFYKGEAIHGFIRTHYGYAQSLGCIELPVSAAKRVWPDVHLGTLVQVSPSSDSKR